MLPRLLASAKQLRDKKNDAARSASETCILPVVNEVGAGGFSRLQAPVTIPPRVVLVIHSCRPGNVPPNIRLKSAFVREEVTVAST
ncbi:hypothetical protein PENSTE_c006G04711 [Penicillium steckii]|uniref:Uncharacterized protein n=1 Tax=Penicillium steckii TaxID=303698 RepID=A0A1V6TGM2_9EURO|nr:hypothetical protein PENSTE_c006G04711 [Penicillium steckii]